ncbi:DSBA oxidoreductase [Burkholderia sp. lig30]|uniref:DsbA family oxidoreductase n=1 Tax=Burkholderia sp. lig30 TaxID=1192124 RepID=UPI000460EA87|nr:DsbA family oxidoreductase [Burkholderia sp. lig30]KDB09597.1 DSBA oxidoreductase [Burkholderia sp. lig30]
MASRSIHFMTCEKERAAHVAQVPGHRKTATAPVADAHKPFLGIQVFVDFICPWCLIGTRHLHAAIKRLAELRPEIEPKVVWRSVQLLPDTPLSGEPYQAFYLARLGGAEAVVARRAQLQQAGRPAGITFSFDDIPLLPNTAAAHRLLAYACTHETDEKQAALVERLLTAFFVDCENIGDPAVLKRLGLECGLSDDGMSEHACTTGGRAGPDADPRRAESRSVSGVPFMVFNGARYLSGAYPADAIVEVMLDSIPARTK